MAAYAYPIIIKLKKQRIWFDEVHQIESDSLTLKELKFIGDASFSILERDEESGFSSGYTICVHRSRLETADEQLKRIQRERAYMKEFNRRKNLELPKKNR